MERAGRPLDFWQQQAVTHMLAVEPDGTWTCFEYVEMVPRQNGKGSILEARALAAMFLLDEQLVMWSAHEYKTAMESFRRLRRLIINLGRKINENLIEVHLGQDEDGEPRYVLVKVLNTHGEEGFERLDTGQRIRFIARSKGSGRGFSGDVNLIDETFAYTAEQHDALLPTMNAMPNPQIVYTSTPPLTSDSGEILYDLRERAEAREESLGYRDWGIAGDLDNLDAIDLDDKDLWAQANPALVSGRVTIKKIAKNRRSMRANKGRGFAREILGVWPARRQGGGAIDMALWVELTDMLSRRSGDVAVCVDIAPNRDFAAIALYGPREDELGHLQLIDYRAGTAWIVPRLVELRDALDPIAVGMGPGTFKSLKPELDATEFVEPDKPEEPERGDLIIISGADMAAATSQMIDATQRKDLRHLGQDPLDGAVEIGRTKQTTDSIVWVRKGNDGDICPLVAASGARWTYFARIHLVAAAGVGPNVW